MSGEDPLAENLEVGQSAVGNAQESVAEGGAEELPTVAQDENGDERLAGVEAAEPVVSSQQDLDEPAPGEALTPDRLDRALARLRSEVPEPEPQKSPEADSHDL